MDDQIVLEKLSRILGDLLADETIRLTMSTTRSQVPNWDSFNYVNFIVAVEAEFGIRFGVADVESFKDVGEIVKEIKSAAR